MQADQWKKIEDLYHAALALPPERRASFLLGDCDDAVVREEVESLLDHQANSFFDSTPLSAIPTVRAGDKLGNFEIRELLGRGGMGEVWRACDSRLNRDVAIKVVVESFTQRFESEARAIASLNHPHICSLFDLGPNYMVMEYIEGETLSARIRKGPLPLQESLETAIQIASALSTAHGKGVVHRDLKPGNIMLTASGAKLLDFGLAKSPAAGAGSDPASIPLDEGSTAPLNTAALEQPTSPGGVMGTLAYMSPEQLRGEQLDTRTDLFNLGAVLYEMVTGRRAFDGEIVTEIHDAILTRAPEPITNAHPHLPQELGRIINKALAKNRETRYQTAEEVRADLEQVKRQKAIPQPLPRFWKILATAVLVMVVAAIGGFIYLRLTQKTPNGAAALLRETRLTGVPANAFYPSFSPDGNEIAYGWLDEQGGGVGIYVKRVEGGNARRITSGPQNDSFPVWSWDGKWIAFARSGSGIYVISALGGAVRRVMTLEEDCNGLDWLPDGQHLVVSAAMRSGLPGTTKEPVRYGLSLVRIDSGQQRPLTEPPVEAFGDGNPAVSPDGKTVAFTRQNGPGFFANDLYLMPLDGGPPRRLATDMICFAWMPDGREIVFWSKFRLWRIPVTGGTPRAINLNAELITQLTIARHRGRLGSLILKRDRASGVSISPALFPPCLADRCASKIPQAGNLTHLTHPTATESFSVQTYLVHGSCGWTTLRAGEQCRCPSWMDGI